MALAGAELLLYPTAIGWDPDEPGEQQQHQLNAWQTVQRAHAIANGIPLLVCNRTGFEADSSGQTAGIQFWGSSFVAGPQGEVLASATPDSEELLITPVNMKLSEEVRRSWPYLRDRRVDAYDDLSLRFRDTT
jgi:N-carbamoylputrescine amidase